jgi:integrase
MSKKLTQIAIEKIKPDLAKRRELPDAGKPGLYLVVQPSGKKSWAVRYRRLSDGRPRKLTLNGFPSLALARKHAQDALDKVADGLDPAAEKKAARAGRGSDLVRDIAAQFMERHIRPNTRASYARETERLLNKEMLPRWGDRRLQEIDKRDVLDLLDSIIDRGGGLTANRALAAIRKLFNWSIQRGIIAVSPVAGISAPLAEQSRDRVLGDHEIAWLWRAGDRLAYPFGDLAKLLLLTGQRRNEVAGMTWGELHLEKREWQIPGERTKNGEPHLVPLSDPALCIIQGLPRKVSRRGFVFTTNGESHVSGYSRAKVAIDKLMLVEARTENPEAELPPWRFHDLRRTVASGLARLGVSLPVIEKTLNHSSGTFSGVVGVYQRHSFADEKRNALEAWARFVLSLQQPPNDHATKSVV